MAKSETEAIWEKRRAGEIGEASIDCWHEYSTIEICRKQYQGGVLQIRLTVRRTDASRARQLVRNE